MVRKLVMDKLPEDQLGENLIKLFDFGECVSFVVIGVQIEAYVCRLVKLILVIHSLDFTFDFGFSYGEIEQTAWSV